ncbi:hypothetical protein ACFYR1_32515 [Streptomyces canus]|uniref:hypothetical protein n=1 Tax=Streptomyces canus TaxID=58343 RepID=UPI0036CCB827
MRALSSGRLRAADRLRRRCGRRRRDAVRRGRRRGGPAQVLGAAAGAAERAGADATGSALVTKARLIVQRKGITAAFAKPFADADRLLLTGHYEEAVAKPAQAYRSA